MSMAYKLFSIFTWQIISTLKQKHPFPQYYDIFVRVKDVKQDISLYCSIILIGLIYISNNDFQKHS